MERKRYTWKTANLTQETADTLTITFDTNGQALKYKAGQFVNVCLVVNGEAVSRSYSLSSSPRLDRLPSITVKRLKDGLVSEYIFSNADKVKKWDIEGPHGLFYVSNDVLLADHVVLIAGGSGISPIYSMLRYLLRYMAGRLTLIYSTKVWKETIFLRKLMELENRFQARLKIVYTVTEPHPSDDYEGCQVGKGRLSQLQLKKLVKQSTSPTAITHYFICGPDGLITKTEQALADLKVHQKFIHTEYFTAPKDSNHKLPTETKEVLFHFHDQSNLLEVHPGDTILDAAAAYKIAVPSSCKNGTCGLCTAKVTSGTVLMKKNFVLNETMLQQGFRLLCQSHPLDNNVTIEIN